MQAATGRQRAQAAGVPAVPQIVRGGGRARRGAPDHALNYDIVGAWLTLPPARGTERPPGVRRRTCVQPVADYMRSAVMLMHVKSGL